MSWASIAASLIGARPVYLYKIQIGSETAFYTSRSADYSAAPASLAIDFFQPDDFFSKIDFFEETFSKRAIGHSVIKTTENSKKKYVTITLPRTDLMAQRFLGPLGIADMNVSIWQGFENDTIDKEFIQIFVGEVQISKPTWATVSLVCEDSGTRSRGKGIAAVIQRPCRHALYHGKCGLLLANYQTTGSATAISGNVLTVSEASSQADGYYSGGIVSYNGDMQLITAHTGTALTLLAAVGPLEADIAASGPQTVLLARGCNRSISNCDDFGNSDNFGGFNRLTDSPFDGRSMT